MSAEDRSRIHTAIEAILDGYTRGTRFGIRADSDGLLAAGVPGVQLTWMDARVGDRVMTPRIGKPVEVQALWINALWIGAHVSPRWKEPLTRALTSFDDRFWNEAAGALYDVVDVDHVPGTADASFRPNQILAVGGLPLALIDGVRARRVIDAVEQRLWTPLGLRSLASGESAYVGRYAGGVASRDGAYHQGTVWPWLLGPFVDAWVQTRGKAPAAVDEARTRFLDPLLAHLDTAGLGHLPEVADGDPPHTPGGCPFQAWSIGEALRLDRLVLARTAQRDTAEGHKRLIKLESLMQQQSSCPIHGKACHVGLFGRNLFLGQRIPLAGVAHQNGTLRFGTDPRPSVLDANCRTHDVDNLYAVDGSFFPSSGAVNPALTIMANALRVGDHLLTRLGRKNGALAAVPS